MAALRRDVTGTCRRPGGGGGRPWSGPAKDRAGRSRTRVLTGWRPPASRLCVGPLPVQGPHRRGPPSQPWRLRQLVARGGRGGPSPVGRSSSPTSQFTPPSRGAQWTAHGPIAGRIGSRFRVWSGDRRTSQKFIASETSTRGQARRARRRRACIDPRAFATRMSCAPRSRLLSWQDADERGVDGLATTMPTRRASATFGDPHPRFSRCGAQQREIPTPFHRVTICQSTRRRP
jgi:hypothetical protein